jgi:hypothetical protein
MSGGDRPHPWKGPRLKTGGRANMAAHPIPIKSADHQLTTVLGQTRSVCKPTGKGRDRLGALRDGMDDFGGVRHFDHHEFFDLQSLPRQIPGLFPGDLDEE